jgi:hypothetical protein
MSADIAVSELTQSVRQTPDHLATTPAADARCTALNTSSRGAWQITQREQCPACGSERWSEIVAH